MNNNSKKLSKYSSTLRPTSMIFEHNGNLCGVFSNLREQYALALGIATVVSACAFKTTVLSGGVEQISTVENDLQAVLTNVVKPIQESAEIEAQVPMVPSYWYHENAALVCEVGTYCIHIEQVSQVDLVL
jgi:hypothetical protein